MVVNIVDLGEPFLTVALGERNLGDVVVNLRVLNQVLQLLALKLVGLNCGVMRPCGSKRFLSLRLVCLSLGNRLLDVRRNLRWCQAAVRPFSVSFPGRIASCSNALAR